MSTGWTWDAEPHLSHHGIQGMHWGVRRYQNPDGTLTALGKLRVGRQVRKENRLLKKDIREDNHISKEWQKDRNKFVKKAIKDDGYRKTIADLEAHRLKMDPKEMDEMMDAYLAGERAADNIKWYKHGNRQHDVYRSRIERGEKITKSLVAAQKRINQRHKQKENYKLLKSSGKKQDFNEVYKALPNKDLNKLVKAIDKEAIAYLSGNKKYSDHADTPSRKIRGKMVSNYIGKYGHKKVYGPNGNKEYAVNAVHRIISNAADREAYGGNYDEFLKKHAKKRG